MEKRVLTLTIPARRDLRSIRRHSIEMWGRDPAEAYLSLLRSTAESLGGFPERGWLVDGECTNLSQDAIGSHIIYYRVSEEEVEILRILHERTDTSALFN